ncbi:hypothetical protein IAT40_002717 [Kwoniella sp. CBS 6097]
MLSVDPSQGGGGMTGPTPGLGTDIALFGHPETRYDSTGALQSHGLSQQSFATMTGMYGQTHIKSGFPNPFDGTGLMGLRPTLSKCTGPTRTWPSYTQQGPSDPRLSGGSEQYLVDLASASTPSYRPHPTAAFLGSVPAGRQSSLHHFGRHPDLQPIERTFSNAAASGREILTKAELRTQTDEAGSRDRPSAGESGSEQDAEEAEEADDQSIQHTARLASAVDAIQDKLQHLLGFDQTTFDLCVSSAAHKKNRS